MYEVSVGDWVCSSKKVQTLDPKSTLSLEDNAWHRIKSSMMSKPMFDNYYIPLEKDLELVVIDDQFSKITETNNGGDDVDGYLKWLDGKAKQSLDCCSVPVITVTRI